MRYALSVGEKEIPKIRPLGACKTEYTYTLAFAASKIKTHTLTHTSASSRLDILCKYPATTTTTMI